MRNDFSYNFDQLVKTIMIIVGAITVSIVTGISIDSANYKITIAIAAIALFALINTMLGKGGHVEALLLGLLVFGYVVGNRGFAAISLSATMPIYLGEVVMMACFTIFLSRTAFTKSRFIPQNALGRTVFLFLVAGTVRFGFDVYAANPQSLLGLRDIVRDFATVYYSFMFFIAYNVGMKITSRRVFEKVLLAAFILLLPSYGLQVLNPDLYNAISVGGMPAIYHKGDTAAAFLAAGSIYFYAHAQHARFRRLWLMLSMFSIWFFAIGFARAALVGLIVANCFLFFAGLRKVIRFQGISLAAGVAFALAMIPLLGNKHEESFLMRSAEKAATIFDFSGSRKYQMDSSESSLQNNRFRQAWWISVYDETMQYSPVFGLGFGYDLAARFLRTYGTPLGEDFDARSPHSIFFTLFGRMGFVGLGLIMAIVLQVIFLAYRYAKIIRSRKGFLYGAAMCAAMIIILNCAFLGVVLEGPVGALTFWVLLGFVASDLKLSESLPKPAEEKLEPTPHQFRPRPRKLASSKQ